MLLGATRVKAERKILVKLTPGFDFINILHTAFVLVDPKSVRFQSSCQYHFTLLGSTSVKAVLRKLMKSTPVLLWYSLFGKSH
jgi:hypothetical protein